MDNGLGLSRRRFLGLGAAGVGSAALSPYLSSLKAFAAPSVGARDGILVTLVFDGGNDGLNTLCPVGIGTYHDLRPNIGIAPGQGLPVSKYLALHPSFRNVKAHWDAGHVAIVQGVGYPQPDLSHFESMDTWMHGWGGAGTPSTGWLGRWLDGLPNAASESLYAVAVDDSVPMHLVGAHSHASSLPLSVDGGFGMDRSDASDRRLYSATKNFGTDGSGLGHWGDLYGDAMSQLMDLTVRIGPAYGKPAPRAYIGQQLALAARLINANLGIRALHVHVGSFDTHADQPDYHARLLAEVDSAIGSFFRYLEPTWKSRTALMTFSEFGRRPEENGDRGTDHGTASVCFVMGTNVKGGLYGAYPPLRDLDDYGNLKASVDFRQVYATILSSWLKADHRQVLGRAYSGLGFFRSGPGTV
ncbi:MAG: hypothetical protein JWL83_2442 [Actinomycetia bacterium]|nr:hypothetical protein [Actinomycetes bacterium]